MFIHCSLLKLFTTVFIGQTRGGSKRKAEGQPETEAGIQPKKSKGHGKGNLHFQRSPSRVGVHTSNRLEHLFPWQV